MNITATSEGGIVVALCQDKLGRWVRPAKWYGDDTAANYQEDKDRCTFDPVKAQRWADELARVCP